MHARKLQTLSCIVPALNEYANLKTLIPLLHTTLHEKYPELQIRVILVDDGSTDATPQLFNELGAQYDLQYIQFSRNFGKEAAIAAGLHAVNTQAAVLLDADMQHPPSLILPMIDYWEQGYDMVYTYRQSRHEESMVKKTGTKLFYTLFFSRQFPANSGDFRLMDLSVVQALNQLTERRRFTKGLYHWVGFSTKAIPYIPDERLEGETHYNLKRLVVLAIDGITSFSVKPLRITLVFGLILSVFGFSYMLWLIISYFLYDTLKGFTTIVVLICALFGVLFLMLGVIGEYLGKIFEETKQRPLYIVQQNLFSPNLLAQQQHYPHHLQGQHIPSDGWRVPLTPLARAGMETHEFHTETGTIRTTQIPAYRTTYMATRGFKEVATTQETAATPTKVTEPTVVSEPTLEQSTPISLFNEMWESDDATLREHLEAEQQRLLDTYDAHQGERQGIRAESADVENSQPAQAPHEILEVSLPEAPYIASVTVDETAHPQENHSLSPTEAIGLDGVGADAPENNSYTPRS